MLRRTAIALLVLLVAGVLAPLAGAASVFVRVEGKTRTIFGATEPRLEVHATALDALESASVLGEFYVHVAQTSFGPYVDQVGLYPASGPAGWQFKVNGASPPVGADGVTLEDGDHVLWYWAALDPTTFAGPKTLALKRTSPNCYAAFAQDDKGVETPASGAAIHVGGKRTLVAASGRACVGPHRGLLVRATLDGAIRSNALP
ncbi:MAG: DUF4430 domain-containing protein [Gaiellaceae bacterium]